MTSTYGQYYGNIVFIDEAQVQQNQQRDAAAQTLTLRGLSITYVWWRAAQAGLNLKWNRLNAAPPKLDSLHSDDQDLFNRCKPLLDHSIPDIYPISPETAKVMFETFEAMVMEVQPDKYDTIQRAVIGLEQWDMLDRLMFDNNLEDGGLFAADKFTGRCSRRERMWKTLFDPKAK
ncbi:unnamed protein product [Peniophora sp. CBMAI 1063]|nr:unnamed protein product [Peniophora sp. CBMAI 1063]